MCGLNSGKERSGHDATGEWVAAGKVVEWNGGACRAPHAREERLPGGSKRESCD